jgi:endopeptidase La
MSYNKPVISLGQIEIDASKFKSQPSYDNIPLLPMRDQMIFPGVTFPIALGRESSINAAEYASENGIPLCIACQKNGSENSPKLPDDVYKYGVVAHVIKVIDIPDGPKTALIHANSICEITGYGTNPLPGDFITASTLPVKEIAAPENDNEFLAIISAVKNTASEIAHIIAEENHEITYNIDQCNDPLLLLNIVSTFMPFDPATKFHILETFNPKQRAFIVLTELERQKEFMSVTRKVQERTKQTITEEQKSAFLRQQLETLKQELYGDSSDEDLLLKRSENVKFPDDVRAMFDRELTKLTRYNPQSPDYAIQYSYLEMLLDLPWGITDTLSNNLAQAKSILDSDHFGLDKVKERILEQIAVLMHTPDGKAPIICLVGAPGVGKTSLGQSIARALNRKYQRVSLGGLHDEAEIRGHRRTYIGALPGRIISAIRKAGSSNPVILLDEIDKIGSDFKGDPGAALLEVLDPEQNCKFHDNYVDVDYDLSKVLFIATANTLSTVSQPLLDRMEVIDLSGYLLEEKVEIAKRHLLPRVLKENNLTRRNFDISDDAIIKIIEGYTSESGVRQLEKQIASVVRKVILKKVSGKKISRMLHPDNVKEYLGVEKFTKDRYEGNDYAGVVTGLAWTSVGGEILYIESSLAKGKGEKLTLTGNLGDVMKESAIIALQYVKSHAAQFGIPDEIFEKYSLHIHVPEGAIPKDGPSAGITMVTSIVSTFTQRKVRPRIAMTGEITLRGKVLPVGGIKEKILAAKRAGIDTIILSSQNRKDIDDITAEYIQGLTFVYVNDITDVINEALLEEKVDSPVIFD